MPRALDKARAVLPWDLQHISWHRTENDWYKQLHSELCRKWCTLS